MGRQPRQRLISCHLCRVRKLRCSRQFPCSNCTSRGVVCQHEGMPAPPAASQQAKTSSKDVSAFDLLSRLERLESLVAAREKEKDQAYPGPEPPAQIAQRAQRAQTTAASRQVPLGLQRLTADALQLERSCSDQKLTDSLISDPIIFRTCPIRLATSQPSYVFQNGVPPAMSGPMDVIKCIWLPRRDEMRIVLQKYIADISYFHHVIHTPTLQSLVEDVYTGLDQNARLDVGGVLLLLTICSSVAYSWSPADDARCLFSSSAEANSQSTFWIKEALDVADQAQRTAYASLESIQALIVLFFVFCNHESVGQRARNVLMLAISMATELSLHRIDDPHSSPSPNIIRMSEARKEIGRRVWWYLVATDWMLSQFSSPQEGFYLIHKEQMAVNKPRNVSDEDMIDGVELIDRPISDPTCVSYFIQRIRLAEVFQGHITRGSLSTAAQEATAYKSVLEADAKYNQFMRELPDFLSLDNSNINNLPPTDSRRFPVITIQRYILNLLLHRQLCQIHLPYLAQGTVNPAYAYSRDMCVRSARVIIELDHQIQQQNLPFNTSRLRLAMVLRSIFLASISLVLNACLKGDSEEDGEREDEVAVAWKILQEAQGQSPTASKLLELSVQILRRYKIKHRALDVLQQQFTDALSPTGTLPMTPESAHPDQQMSAAPQNAAPQTDPALLDQQWQSLDGRLELNTIDWDKLFWGIDAPFI